MKEKKQERNIILLCKRKKNRKKTTEKKSMKLIKIKKNQQTLKTILIATNSKREVIKKFNTSICRCKYFTRKN